MKVYAISDLHLSNAVNKPMEIFGAKWENYLEKIEKEINLKMSNDDILLLCGDLSWALKLTDAICDIEYISKFKGKKVIIKGNHDYWWQSISKVRETLPESVFAIQNDVLKFGDIIICGTRGWTCPENGTLSPDDQKIYLREGERLKLSLEKMRQIRQVNDKVICIMHFPPFNAKRQSSIFTEILSEYKVDAVVYGHLHGKDCRADLKIKLNDTIYYLTSCDLTDNTLTEII